MTDRAKRIVEPLDEADVCAVYRLVLHCLDAGFDPVEWRRRYLGFMKHQYFARAAVVPAEPTPFLTLDGPFDPADIGKMERYVYGFAMNQGNNALRKG